MALSRHHATASRPLSISEIVAQAENFEFSPNVALQRWIRAAKLLQTESAICEQDGNVQSAYLYLYRHAQLVLHKLPQHPDYNDPAFKRDLSDARKAVVKNLQKLETWKPRITQEYERYQEAVRRRDAERQRNRLEREGAQHVGSRTRGASLSSDDGAYDDGNRHLHANEHRELAVDLAHREIRRRDATRQTTWQAGVSPGTVASRRKGLVLGYDHPSEDGPGGHQDYDGTAGVREVGQFVQQDRQQSRDGLVPARRVPSSSIYNYPTVPSRENVMDWRTPTLDPTRNFSTGPAPARPAKERHEDFRPTVPQRPVELRAERSPTATPSPPPPASHVPSRYTFKPSAFTEAGAPLRTVLLPPDLRTTFLNLAHSNTSRNLETCGILCGTMISNALFVNHLIIPDQKSTSDTCDTTEEGDNELFDYCDNKELLVCGWIHTHPSQSCFLSSRDLHTSSGYQIMLPEAIAIVCAPRHNPDWGIFRLTDPPGLPAVLNCHQQGLFHPHAETNLYTDALRPGHVVEGPGLKFEVVDLRH
jgi:STAM-binding protein